MRFIYSFLIAGLLATGAHANEGAAVAKQQWSFDGVRGHWNKDELYRGYTVFTQVCMACHSAKYVSHRDLMRVGFTEAEVNALAKAMNIKPDDKLMTGLDAATAQETYGKVPPDLSVINKARAGLADYTYALLTGYSEDPEEMAKLKPEGVPDGAYFNTAFPGHAIAMPSPLNGPDLVTYHDETKASVEQMAHDVTTFLQWTAEPEKVDRQHTGVYVLLYLLAMLVLAYIVKRVIWSDVKH